MGPPSRSLAAEALGCFLVRITGGSNRIQDRGAMIAPDGGLPSDCQCKNLRPREGARTRTGDLKTSLTLQSPYKGRVPGLSAPGRAGFGRPRCDRLLGEPDRQTPSGSRAPLPEPSPLRTGHDDCSSSGSSLGRFILAARKIRSWMRPTTASVACQSTLDHCIGCRPSVCSALTI